MAPEVRNHVGPPGGMNHLDFMVEAIPNQVHSGLRERGQNPWWAPAWPLVASVAGGMLCHWAADSPTGLTLGLFIGGLIVVAMITGAVVAAEDTWLGRALAWGGAVHGVAGVWFYAAVKADLDLGLWASCYLVLAAMGIAIGGLVVVLREIGVGRTVGGFVATLLAVAWLTWSVWLSPVMGGKGGEHLAGWLVPASPVFAVNSVLRENMGVWAEQPIAYNVSSLSEVAYGLPESVVKCLGVHLGLGAVGVGVAVFARKRRSKT